MIQDSLTISQEEEGEGRKEGPHRKELWHWSWLCALQALEMEHHGRWDRKQNRVRKSKVRSEISWWCNQQQLLIGRQVILPDRDTAWVFGFISLHLWGVRVWLLLQFYLWCHFLPPLLCWSQTGIPPVILLHVHTLIRHMKTFIMNERDYRLHQSHAGTKPDTLQEAQHSSWSCDTPLMIATQMNLCQELTGSYSYEVIRETLFKWLLTL